jgi:hypothetical protein
MVGQAPQLFVDERHQFIQRRAVAAAPGMKQIRDFQPGGTSHGTPDLCRIACYDAELLKSLYAILLSRRQLIDADDFSVRPLTFFVLIPALRIEVSLKLPGEDRAHGYPIELEGWVGNLGNSVWLSPFDVEADVIP